MSKLDLSATTDEDIYETLEEYLDGLIPDKCRGCECGSPQIMGEYPHIDWKYICELDACYLGGGKANQE